LVNISILAELVSAATLYIFFLVCSGIIYKRYVSEAGFSSKKVLPYMAAMTTISAAMSTTYRMFGLQPILVTALAISWIICCFLLWYLFPQSPAEAMPVSKFRIPWSPFIPSLGMLCTLHLFCSLSLLAFIEFVVFLVAGIIVYICYSSRKIEQCIMEAESRWGTHGQEETLELTRRHAPNESTPLKLEVDE